MIVLIVLDLNNNKDQGAEEINNIKNLITLNLGIVIINSIRE